MKYINILLINIAAIILLGSCEESFLDREQEAIESETAIFEDSENAVLATNAIYDAFSWDEGNLDATHTYPWVYGDVMSGDAYKGGGGANDQQGMRQLAEWNADPTNENSRSEWINKYATIYRANLAIENMDVEASKFGDKDLQNRLVGEAKFLRAYAFYTLVRLWGGVPLIEEPGNVSEWGNIERASVAETFAFIYDDLNDAIDKLPLKSTYGQSDLGRATKGAARTLLARAYMFEVSIFGEGNSPNNVTWSMVSDQTGAIIESGQYSLEPNYARLFEEEAENGSESIFELQFVFNSAEYSEDPPGHAENTGTANTVIQGSREHYGWGFNKPSQDLFDVYDDGDPRREVSIVQNGQGVYGVEFAVENAYLQNVDSFASQSANRKYQEHPENFDQNVSSDQNILVDRYGNVLLMDAEAHAHQGNTNDAVSRINQIRTRARNSTYPKGFNPGSNTYDGRDDETPSSLDDLGQGISQSDLLEAIKTERRRELAMESYRYYDLLRRGDLMDDIENIHGSEARARAESHTLDINSQNPYAVIPIPQQEVSSWGLEQNPNY